MKIIKLSGFFVSSWLVCAAFTSQAQVGRYEDVAAWAARQNADSQQFVTELVRAQNAADVAAALRASAQRQRKVADQLIEISRVHPELRNLPELGLEANGVEPRAEPDNNAGVPRVGLPPEVIAISEQMRHSKSELYATTQGRQAIKTLSKYLGDSEVAAAASELRAVAQDNHHRFMQIFPLATLHPEPGTKIRGMPFGAVVGADFDRLAELAKTSGLDLKAQLALVYRNGQPVDEEALARVFRFSLLFNTLDSNARTYGQIIYNSLLNLGEVIGVPAYAKILDRQPPDVQQRIRDFLYYPTLQVSREHRRQAEEEARMMYPSLFPEGFRFGRGDPLFASKSEDRKP